MELGARHEGHHHRANIKYGYIAFGISLVFAFTLAVSNFVYLRKWLKKGWPDRSSVWARLGSPQPVWLQITLWLIVVSILSFLNIHDLKASYTTIIKRVGRLGFYLVPFDILLAVRPSLMATSYLEYISYHKWFLRLILFLISVHSVGYFVKWISTGDTWRKSTKPLNFLGVIVFFLGLALAVISLKPIRSRAYRLFYSVHNITIAAFLTLIFWHARPGVTDAIILSVCLIAFQITQRIRMSHQVPRIVVSDNNEANLRHLRLPKPSGFPSQWSPGAHIRLSCSLVDARSWLFPSHPYTIVSLPSDDYLDLIVKKENRFQIEALRSYTISSPFASLPPPFFHTAERVVILCGGSGISLGLPLLRFLKSNASIHSALHWAVSERRDAFVLDTIGLTHEVNVHVTRDSSFELQGSDAYQPHKALLSDGEQIELKTLGRCSDDLPEPNYEQTDGPKSRSRIIFHTGRPSPDTIFASLLGEAEKVNCWIVVCGPDSMIVNATNWGKDNGVQVFLEHYGF